MTTIAQGFGDVRTRMPWWLLGALALSSGNDEIRTAINSSPQAAQVMTSTVSDPGDDTDIVFIVNGVTMTVNTGTGLDATGIAAAIVVAINAEPLVRGQVKASSSTTTLTLTALTPGNAFTWTESDASLTTPATATANAAASAIDFGRAVVRTGNQDTDELVALAASARFSAQVITVGMTYVSGAVVEAAVYETRGDRRVFLGSARFASATDQDTSIDGLVAALNTVLPANTVDVAADAGTATALVFTAEIAGFEFDVEFHLNSGGASAPVFTRTYTTGPSEATSFHRAFRGVTLRDDAIGAETIGGTEQRFPPNSALAYVRKGTIAVESSQTIVASDTVFVELGVTDDNGKFFNTASATRVAMDRARAVWALDANTDTGSLAALRLL